MDRKLLLGVSFAIFFTSFGFFAPSVFAALTFSLEFGSSGSNDDELSEPIDVALNRAGDEIFIADKDNHRVNVFDEDGNAQFNFGSNGAGNGQFDEPTGIIVDESGDVFVVDLQNNRVQKFNSNGNFELKFGSSNSNDPDYLGNPYSIAIQESTGDIYVSSLTDSISVFESDGDFSFGFGTFGTDDGEFSNPSSIIIDNSKEILYVADTDNDRIQIFELVGGTTCPSGTQKIVNGICFVEKFGSTGNDDGQFNSPSGLAIDESNDLLYVADTNNDRIQLFDLVGDSTCSSGTTEVADGICFVEEFGSVGSGDGKFNSPSGLAIDESNDLLYVTDTNNDRIQVFSLTTTSNNAPGKPTNLEASPASPTSIILTWNAPTLDDDTPEITGYKIEFKTGTDGFSTLVEDTNSGNTYFLHEGLETNDEYFYRIYAINSAGTSSSSSTSSAKPQHTTVPSGLTATPISPKAIKLSWNPPSETYNQQITGYTIKEVIIIDPVVYDDIAEVNSTPTSYTVSNLNTDETYTYVVVANFPLGSSDVSNSASATPRDDSTDTTSASTTIPSEPRLLTAVPSSNQVKLSWSPPSSDGNSPITGYKIQMQTGSSSYTTIIENTKSSSTTYTHLNLNPQTTYNYKIFAINSVGTSRASAEVSATTSEFTLALKPLGKFSIEEGKTLSFTVGVSDETLKNLEFSLANNPQGASIDKETGLFTWTPSELQGSGTYTFDIIVKKGSSQDSENVTITVIEIEESVPPEPAPPKGIAPFVDPNKDPQYYIDRYDNEPTYKEWFDTNYPDRTIYEAVGLPNPEPEPTPKGIAPFVDPNKDPQYYIDRYDNEPTYKEWFDTNYPDRTIYEAVGLEKPTAEEVKTGICGANTKLVDGVCERVLSEIEGGGCLIATATYGSEMMPQVQELRELRDIKLLSTDSGKSFISEFNQFYYSFSPTIADWERQNPIFKEAVKISLLPLITSLSTLNFVNLDSEAEVLGYGISLILLNIGMYFVTPAIIIWKIKKHI